MICYFLKLENNLSLQIRTGIVDKGKDTNKSPHTTFSSGFLNKVSYVHQLEKKLMNSNNKVADQESKWEKFQLFCRSSENSNKQ